MKNKLKISSLSKELQDQIMKEIAEASEPKEVKALETQTRVNLDAIEDLLKRVVKNETNLNNIEFTLKLEDSNKFIEIKSEDLLKDMEVEKLFDTLEIEGKGLVRAANDITIPLNWKWKTFDGRTNEEKLLTLHCDSEGNLLKVQKANFSLKEEAMAVEARSLKTAFRFVDIFNIDSEETTDQVVSKAEEVFKRGNGLGVSMVSFPDSIEDLSVILPSTGNKILYVSAVFHKIEKISDEAVELACTNNKLVLKLGRQHLLQEIKSF